jgi:hypothetical protein
LEDAGLPLYPREQAWRDFKGWRVNYDSLINDLCKLLTVTPPTLTKRAESPV